MAVGERPQPQREHLGAMNRREGIHGAHYLEKAAELAHFRGIFAKLWSRSAPLEDLL